MKEDTCRFNIEYGYLFAKIRGCRLRNIFATRKLERSNRKLSFRCYYSKEQLYLPYKHRYRHSIGRSACRASSACQPPLERNSESKNVFFLYQSMAMT